MWELLEAIENSGFATWVRETPSVFGYSTILAFHTFGMAFLVGLSGVIAVRVLGVAPSLPIAPLKRFFPLIILGFWVNAVTGVVLTMLAIRSLLTNWDFYVKLVAIALAIVCLQQLKGYAFGDKAGGGAPAASRGKLWAAAMLAFWGVAILAGRLTAYSNVVRRQTIVAVLIAVALLFVARFVVIAVAGRIGAHPSARQKSSAQAHVTTSSN
jgi:hypothetical protein